MDEYASIDYGKDYLAHHGVKGMKWGVRNTIERMGISRKLKKNEKEYVKNQQQMLNAVRIKNRLKEKGRNTQLIDKQINAINTNITKNKNTTKQLVKDAKSKGYSVSSKDTRTGAQNYAVKSATRSAALSAAISGLSGAATAAAYLGAAATVPITAPAAAIILGSYAAGAAAGGAAKGGLLGGAMGASYGSAVVSMQRKRGYQYADKVFNKNNDVPASILYKKYSVSDMKHFDEFYSDYLAHHGVKGMKWGVRKSVERTGRVVRKMGGAVKNSASRIAGGLVRTGSAVRRFKNRRAIKSGNANRITKRMSKMNTQELSEAVSRMQLANQIAANKKTNTLGDVISNNLKQKVGQMSQNALETSVSSILLGESPLTGMVRNAQAQKAKQEQEISQNRSNTIANNYKIANSALQNTLNVAGIKAKIAENNYKAANDRQNLRNLMSSQSSASTVQNGAKIAESLFARPKPPLYSQATRMNSFGRSSAKIVLYDNGVKPIVDLNAATRRYNTGAYTPRFVRHDDTNEYASDFLAHHGVLGMKWGVRKDDTGDIYVDADDVYRRRESSNKGPSNDIEDRGYTYVYDPSNTRDEEFYTQFGNRVVDKTFEEDAKIAGYESAGKAFCDHIFDTNDFDEVKYTDTMFKSAQKENGERHVMSLLSAPYDPGKSPEENRSNYENRLTKYGARTLGSGMGAERHPWLDDEEHREEDGRDPDTARNDAARRIADVLKNEGYIGMRDFKDIAGTAGVESPTILFNKDRNMYDEAYRKEIDKRLLGL